MKILLCIAILVVFVAVAWAMEPRKELELHSDFCDAMNEWARAGQVMSPYSPDYAERRRVLWQELEIGQKFRALEDEVSNVD